MRVLGMFYVVFDHVYFDVLIYPTLKPQIIHDKLYPLWFQIIPGGVYAVDVFFYLSLFLEAYLMVLKFEKSKSPSFVMVYFYRYYRLAPTVFLVIMFVMTFYRMLGDDPVWNYSVVANIGKCPKYWWSFVLFINSFIIKDSVPICFTWLWYLLNDMMFSVLLPIQVFLYLEIEKLDKLQLTYF